MEIFVDAAFEFHKWHSDLLELGLTEGGSGTIIGLRWDKQRDIVSIAVPSEKVESTSWVY